eukprot:6207702-Pleurochrysis_carterae.AAC.2
MLSARGCRLLVLSARVANVCCPSVRQKRDCPSSCQSARPKCTAKMCGQSVRCRSVLPRSCALSRGASKACGRRVQSQRAAKACGQGVRCLSARSKRALSERAAK